MYNSRSPLATDMWQATLCLSSSCCSEPQCTHVQLSPFYHLSTVDVMHVRKILGPPRSSYNRKRRGPGNEASSNEMVSSQLPIKSNFM